MVLLRHIETHCVPILTYAIEVTHIANRDEARSLRVAYNALLWISTANFKLGVLPLFSWFLVVQPMYNPCQKVSK